MAKRSKRRASRGRSSGARSGGGAARPRAQTAGRDRRTGADAPRGRLRLFLRAAGAPFWSASALAVAVGSTLPFWLRPDGFRFGLLHSIEALVGIVLIHAGADLANEYYDFGADVRNPNRGDLSGGSGALPDGAIEARFIRTCFIICFALGAAIGLHLNSVTPGNTILLLGVLGVLGGYFYSAPPLRLCYRGLGEIVLGFCFGVLPILGAYYVQAHEIGWRVVLASLPLTFAIVTVLWINQIPDVAPDRDAGKRTLVVLLGPRVSARVVLPVLVTLVFLSLFAGAFTGSVIPLALVAVLAFGLARTVVADAWNHYDEPSRLVEAQHSALRLHLAFGLIMALSALAAMGN